MVSELMGRDFNKPPPYFCIQRHQGGGVSAKRIQVWVGHRSITETMDTYGHLFPDDFEEMTTMIDMGSWEDTELSAKVEIA
jgi:hypothetical protein